MEWIDVALKISQIGSTGLLAIAVWGLVVGKVVPRWLYDRESRRADSWETLYHRERSYTDSRLPKVTGES